MTDPLEQTLRELQFDLPVGLVERALAASRREPVRRARRSRANLDARWAGLTAAAVGLVLAANWLAAYFAPAYQQVLADAPVLGSVAGPILTYSGLQSSPVTAFNQSATSSGHTIKLVSGYADTERTVLIVNVDNRPHSLPNKQQACCAVEGSLTDQFGHNYQQVNSPDPLSPTFEPIVWPASRLGARLTLHITILSGISITTGDWLFHVTLFQQPGVALPLPPPVTANSITYTFTSIHLSGDLIDVRYNLSGGPIEHQRALIHSGNFPPAAVEEFGQSYVWPRLVGEGGAVATIDESGYSIPKQGPMEALFNAVLSGPGQYVLTLGEAAGAPTVVITVP